MSLSEKQLRLETLLEIQRGSQEQDRRKKLVQAMEANENKGNDCLSCEGRCCTFSANSMKVTPIEALDLVVDMVKKGRWNESWKDRLLDQVKRDRLGDDIPTDGKRDLIRRTYTCPFFKVDGDFGCGIERWKKPYGCLAFNPNSSGQTEGGDCSSDIKSLENQETTFSKLESEINHLITEELGFSFSKKDLPSAILAYMDTLPLEPS